MSEQVPHKYPPPSGVPESNVGFRAGLQGPEDQWEVTVRKEAAGDRHRLPPPHPVPSPPRSRVAKDATARRVCRDLSESAVMARGCRLDESHPQNPSEEVPKAALCSPRAPCQDLAPFPCSQLRVRRPLPASGGGGRECPAEPQCDLHRDSRTPP